MMLNDQQYHEYQELNDFHHPKEKIKILNLLYFKYEIISLILTKNSMQKTSSNNQPFFFLFIFYVKLFIY